MSHIGIFKTDNDIFKTNNDNDKERDTIQEFGPVPVLQEDEQTLAAMSFHNTYQRMSEDPNNFSKWWPHLLALPEQRRQLRLPKTKIFQVPEDVAEAFFLERKGDMDIIRKWAEDIMPEITKLGFVPMFIKNGTFSDKFYFRANCLPPDPLLLASSIQRINYEALCVGAEGITELVVREYIPADRETVPCIYGGLPLRPEFRVFYDFDRHIPLYTVNYWDWKTCADNICRDATDRIVYSAQYGSIETEFQLMKGRVEDMVAHDMFGVQLSGVWSVDVLESVNPAGSGSPEKQFWLIDMAHGEQSTYYDHNRVQRILADYDNNKKLTKKLLSET